MGNFKIDNRAEYHHVSNKTGVSFGASAGPSITRNKPIIFNYQSKDGTKKGFIDEEQMLYGVTVNCGVQKEFECTSKSKGFVGAEVGVTVGNGLATNIQGYYKGTIGNVYNYSQNRYTIGISADYLNMGIFSNPKDKTNSNVTSESAQIKLGLESRYGRKAAATIYGNIGGGVEHTSANMPIVNEELLYNKKDGTKEDSYEDIMYNPANNPNKEYQRTSVTSGVLTLNAGVKVDIPLGDNVSLAPFFNLELTNRFVDERPPISADFQTGVRLNF